VPKLGVLRKFSETSPISWLESTIQCIGKKKKMASGEKNHRLPIQCVKNCNLKLYRNRLHKLLGFVIFLQKITVVHMVKIFTGLVNFLTI
jgi:hypothetical protein